MPKDLICPKCGAKAYKIYTLTDLTHVCRGCGNRWLDKEDKPCEK